VSDISTTLVLALENVQEGAVSSPVVRRSPVVRSQEDLFESSVSIASNLALRPEEPAACIIARSSRDVFTLYLTLALSFFFPRAGSLQLVRWSPT